MQEKSANCKQNGRNNATEMQNRRDTIPNQRTKPASNAGLMDGGHRNEIPGEITVNPIVLPRFVQCYYACCV